MEHTTPRLLLLAPLPLGDTLFITPTIRALRLRYPAAHLAVVALGSNAPLLAHNPDLDDVYMLPVGHDWRGRQELLRGLLHLREQRFQAALSFGAPTLAWLPILLRIPRQEFLDFSALWWLLPWQAARWRTVHAVELFATAARHYDIGPVERRLRVTLTPSERGALQYLLYQRNLDDGTPLVAIHPGSGAAPHHKRWPVSHFAQLARDLVRYDGAHVLIIGGKNETALAQQLERAADVPLQNFVGRINVRQALALLETCHLFVGNDSGPLHMATAVGTPVVGIYGPTDPQVYGPCAPADRAIVIQPEGVQPHLHFVGGATLWAPALQRFGVPSSLAKLKPEPVLEAGRLLLARQRRIPFCWN